MTNDVKFDVCDLELTITTTTSGEIEGLIENRGQPSPGLLRSSYVDVALHGLVNFLKRMTVEIDRTEEDGPKQ
ncbi:hypothetical protein COP1_018426 [Malus domestica]